MITIPQILLILFALGLFITLFYACFYSTKGPVSIYLLKARLNLLKMKYANHTPVDPKTERRVMGELQNTIKATCSQDVISENADLKALFFVNCNTINGMIKTGDLINRTQWLKFGALMNDFNDQYFPGKTGGVLQPQ